MSEVTETALCACGKPAFTKAGLCRGCNLKEARKKQAAKPATVKADEFDRKLDHFQYTRNASELDAWEADQKISPLHLPDDIKAKYGDMRFRWVSKSKLDKRGAGYQGWQLFSDSKYPEGVKRGNDLLLAAMPEERARRYNEFTRRASDVRMRELQENDLENRFKRDAAVIKQMGGDVEVTGTGITIDRSAKGAKRGMHPEEARERIIKQREERAKGRVYFHN